ncbi:MarR family transcriptional regulator [Nocardiopsis sp. TSRI0078]|uniref:MarR family winged helix-turn-helix transcriptional regulator n=1 Tax=unclassified Nocardiopsis TaxID=2649073 RepID=UPI00093DE89E|nr:MarR family transcriptional regulator [Nocardiopsis sp. TSRI0078]OKI19766.1 MarR family transcriptional regulator [Nocardiopsis sp. TSRI0078]
MAEAEGGNPLALDNQLCFSLYAASRALTGLYRELLGELGLTYPQYLVMLVLWERGTLTVKELSHALHLDSGTLSPLLRRLEGAGLLTRERSATDERVVEVSATRRGEELRARAEGVPDRVLCAADLPPGRAAALRDALDQITRSVETSSRHASC